MLVGRVKLKKSDDWARDNFRVALWIRLALRIRPGRLGREHRLTRIGLSGGSVGVRLIDDCGCLTSFPRMYLSTLILILP